MARQALGRGLGALIPQLDGADASEVLQLDLDEIRPSKYQPRRTFDDERLRELASSIKAHGVIQPLVVRRTEGVYELIAGERRWRASRLAGLTQVPVIVKDLTEAEVMKVALVENLQREDLDVMEEAEAYQRLIVEFAMTQEEVAVAVGKSRPLVANTIRLLQLPEEIRGAVSRGTISAGHGRAILALNGARSQTDAFRTVVAKGLNVRQTEQLVEETKSPRKKSATRRVSSRDPEVRVIEERLKGALGTKVRITAAKGRGTIEIEYYGFEDLDRLVSVIAGEDAM